MESNCKKKIVKGSFQLSVIKPKYTVLSNYSWLPVTLTLSNSNLPLIQSECFSLQAVFFTIWPLMTQTPDNSNLLRFPLKVRLIRSQLYSDWSNWAETIQLTNHNSNQINATAGIMHRKTHVSKKQLVLDLLVIKAENGLRYCNQLHSVVKQN